MSERERGDKEGERERECVRERNQKTERQKVRMSELGE